MKAAVSPPDSSDPFVLRVSCGRDLRINPRKARGPQKKLEKLAFNQLGGAADANLRLTRKKNGLRELSPLGV